MLINSSFKTGAFILLSQLCLSLSVPAKLFHLAFRSASLPVLHSLPFLFSTIPLCITSLLFYQHTPHSKAISLYQPSTGLVEDPALLLPIHVWSIIIQHNSPKSFLSVLQSVFSRALKVYLLRHLPLLIVFRTLRRLSFEGRDWVFYFWASSLLCPSACSQSQALACSDTQASKGYAAETLEMLGGKWSEAGISVAFLLQAGMHSLFWSPYLLSLWFCAAKKCGPGLADWNSGPSGQIMITHRYLSGSSHTKWNQWDLIWSLCHNYRLKEALSLLFLKKVKVLVIQSCPTLCDPMECSPPGSSVHGILQRRILEWVAILFSRGSSLLRDGTQVFHIPDRSLTSWATRKACSWRKLDIYLESLGDILAERTHIRNMSTQRKEEGRDRRRQIRNTTDCLN